MSAGVADGARPIRSLLDRRVLSRAVLVTLILAVPPLVAVRLVKGSDLAGRESNLWLGAVVVLLIAYFVGGTVAARGARDLHLTHSAGAAAYAFAMMAVGSAVVGEALGAHVANATFLLVVLMVGTLCVSAGTLGGYLVLRWREKRR